MRKLRVVHYGIGHAHSSVTLAAARRYPELFDIVAACEPDPIALEQFRYDSAYDGIPFVSEKEMFALPDIDAAFCEGRVLRNVRDAQKCIDHGWHVHMDKPGGTDLDEFAHLLYSAEEKGLTMQMGYMYRYNPALRYILQQQREGKIGTITGIDTSFGICQGIEKRRWLKSFPGGNMFILGCHCIDMILQIMGEPKAVHGFNRSSDWDNDGTLDTCFAVLEYPNCVCSVRANACEINGYAMRHLRVMGTKKTLDVMPLEVPTILKETEFDETAKYCCANDSHDVRLDYISGRYDEMLKDFAACARGEKKNPYSADYELLLQKIILKACGK